MYDKINYGEILCGPQKTIEKGENGKVGREQRRLDQLE